jgi:hypothetical protein
MAVPIFCKHNIIDKFIKQIIRTQTLVNLVTCTTDLSGEPMQADACTQEKGMYQDNTSYIQTVIFR